MCFLFVFVGEDAFAVSMSQLCPGGMGCVSWLVLLSADTVWPFPAPDLPDQVLRVFKADQQSRYIMISKDTTAKEVVIQAIREFAVTATPDQYSLCEVSVTAEGVIKQRRLPDQLSKLADRIQLSGRYSLSRHPLLSEPTSRAKRQHTCCCCFVFTVVRLEPKALPSTLPLKGH